MITNGTEANPSCVNLPTVQQIQKIENSPARENSKKFPCGRGTTSNHTITRAPIENRLRGSIPQSNILTTTPSYQFLEVKVTNFVKFLSKLPTFSRCEKESTIEEFIEQEQYISES